MNHQNNNIRRTRTQSLPSIIPTLTDVQENEVLLLNTCSNNSVFEDEVSLSAWNCNNQSVTPHSESMDNETSSVTDEDELPTTEYDCGVCFELLYDPITLPCGHICCLDCFKTHVQMAKQNVVQGEAEVPLIQVECPAGCRMRQSCIPPHVTSSLRNRIQELYPQQYAVRHAQKQHERRAKEEKHLAEEEVKRRTKQEAEECSKRDAMLVKEASEIVDKLLQVMNATQMRTMDRVQHEHDEERAAEDSSSDSASDDEEDNRRPFHAQAPLRRVPVPRRRPFENQEDLLQACKDKRTNLIKAHVRHGTLVLRSFIQLIQSVTWKQDPILQAMNLLPFHNNVLELDQLTAECNIFIKWMLHWPAGDYHTAANLNTIIPLNEQGCIFAEIETRSGRNDILQYFPTAASTGSQDVTDQYAHQDPEEVLFARNNQQTLEDQAIQRFPPEARRAIYTPTFRSRHCFDREEDSHRFHGNDVGDHDLDQGMIESMQDKVMQLEQEQADQPFALYINPETVPVAFENAKVLCIAEKLLELIRVYAPLCPTPNELQWLSRLKHLFQRRPTIRECLRSSAWRIEFLQLLWFHMIEFNVSLPLHYHHAIRGTSEDLQPRRPQTKTIWQHSPYKQCVQLNPCTTRKFNADACLQYVQQLLFARNNISITDIYQQLECIQTLLFKTMDPKFISMATSIQKHYQDQLLIFTTATTPPSVLVSLSLKQRIHIASDTIFKNTLFHSSTCISIFTWLLFVVMLFNLFIAPHKKSTQSLSNWLNDSNTLVLVLVSLCPRIANWWLFAQYSHLSIVSKLFGVGIGAICTLSLSLLLPRTLFLLQIFNITSGGTTDTILECLLMYLILYACVEELYHVYTTRWIPWFGLSTDGNVGKLFLQAALVIALSQLQWSSLIVLCFLSKPCLWQTVGLLLQCILWITDQFTVKRFQFSHFLLHYIRHQLQTQCSDDDDSFPIPPLPHNNHARY